MSRDALIRNGTIIFLDRSENDVTALPKGASIICESDWLKLIDGDEAAYIKSMGWKLSE